MSSREEPPRTRPRDTSVLAEPLAFGRFLLRKRIAVGGMSEVYLAQPAEGSLPAPELVIKRLLPSLLDDPQSRKTFETEARLNAAARHPNVVEVFEAGEVDGEPYLAIEYVSGVDTFRLMRRAQSELRPIPAGVCVYLAREVCKALARVHRLSDESGQPLGIVHRDVTPSNIYLSVSGDVKLGDFGIARAIAHARVTASHAIRGKYGYLAPEQVAGENADHRADLFSLAVVLTELLIGKTLFPGGGQLAVLLAIRDCRLDPLRAVADLLPRGLLTVLERGLAKSPEARFPSAEKLYDALAPFELPRAEILRAELASLVTWARDSGSLARKLEGQIREASHIDSVRVETLTRPEVNETPVEVSPLSRRTIPAPNPSRATVRTSDGRIHTGLTFAKLVELIITGELSGHDQVDMDNQGFVPLTSIEALARHLPPLTATTTRMTGPGVPDYAAEFGTTNMLEVLGWLLQRRESGVLFVERPSPSGPPASSLSGSAPPQSSHPTTRKELYIENTRLVLVASTEPSELLGEYLVRQGALDRSELDMALAAMPRYEGRLGDTLIGLGLVDPVDVFRAIQSQGRARVADIFRWNRGRVSFYRGITPQRVDFRLDLELPELMLAGVEESVPSGSLMERYKKDLDCVFAPIRPPPPHALAVNWPPIVLTVISALGTGRRLSDALNTLGTVRHIDAADVLRAVEVALAGGIVHRKTSTPR